MRLVGYGFVDNSGKEYTALGDLHYFDPSRKDDALKHVKYLGNLNPLRKPFRMVRILIDEIEDDNKF